MKNFQRKQSTRFKPTMAEKKNLFEAYIIAISFGWLGFHQFYLDRKVWGCLYFFTGGLFGIGYFVDLIRLPLLVRNANTKVNDDEQEISDVYLLWFTLGLLGVHHFYLKNYKLGILYACTLGVFGFGWIVDSYFIRLYVTDARNNKDSFKFPPESLASLGLAVTLALSPLGIFGAHHYYLGRYGFGMAYTFSLGLFGVGYIIDWFRTPHLFSRYGDGRIYMDDVYMLWFFFGFLGVHHFYLRRPYWGMFYALTFGALGVGWLIDSYYIQTLVKQYNREQVTPGMRTGNGRPKKNNQRKNNDYASMCQPTSHKQSVLNREIAYDLSHIRQPFNPAATNVFPRYANGRVHTIATPDFTNITNNQNPVWYPN